MYVSDKGEIILYIELLITVQGKEARPDLTYEIGLVSLLLTC